MRPAPELELLEARPPAGAPAAPPLLFVHGAWHGAWCWEQVLPLVAQRGHPAFAVSLRGHGESAGRERLRWASLRDYADDVARAVARVGTSPVLVGHSMGALVVQRYLARGGAAAGAVLLAPAPLRGAGRVTRWMLRRYPLVVLEANLTLRLWPVVRSPARARALLLPAAASDAEAAAVHARLGDESYLAYLGMMSPRIDPAQVRVPVLVLAAGEDRLFTAEEVRATARAYGGEVEVVPGAAHDLMLGPSAGAVAARISAWARALPGAQEPRPLTAS